jgi:hypothetical protein
MGTEKYWNLFVPLMWHIYIDRCLLHARLVLRVCFNKKKRDKEKKKKGKEKEKKKRKRKLREIQKTKRKMEERCLPCV